jgi:5-formyltetrahydrofolate cyclo-ligase
MKTKNDLRERVWKAMAEQGVALFPGARGRIPNFRGAEKAARLLAALPEWERAKNIKSNPDSPQRSVRRVALHSGKTLYMAVPRLRDKKCFVELDPSRIPSGKLVEASSIKGAFQHGSPCIPERFRRSI